MGCNNLETGGLFRFLLVQAWIEWTEQAAGARLYRVYFGNTGLKVGLLMGGLVDLPNSFDGAGQPA